MGNRHIFLLIVMTILTMSFVVAQPSYKTETDVTLSIPCTINGATCGTTATCNGTIINPEGTTLVNQQVMTKNGAVFDLNLTANQTDVLGEYQFTISCSQAGSSSSKNLVFFITPNGELPTSAKGIMYLGLLAVLIIFFVIGIYCIKESQGIVGKSAFGLVSYLLMIGVTFIAWNLSMDYLTSAPFLASFFRIFFYVLLYALFPLILFLTFYTMWMIKKIDVIENMIDKGMPIDEAYERTVKSGMKGRKNW